MSGSRTTAPPTPPVVDKLELRIANIARVCHEQNRAYCASIGDDTQPAWTDAPQWQRESAIEGVLRIWSGEVKRPEDSHTAWSAHKIADGWTYGPAKDPLAKTHPCLVDFADLPDEQQMKDVLFLSTARALLGLPADAPTAPAPESRETRPPATMPLDSDLPWPSEVLEAFAFWLAKRDEIAGPFSKIHEPAQARALAARFCAAQGYATPRSDFLDRFRPFPP